MVRSGFFLLLSHEAQHSLIRESQSRILADLAARQGLNVNFMDNFGDLYSNPGIPVYLARASRKP